VGVGLAAGGFVIAATVHVFRMERYEPIARPTVLTAFLGYLLVIVALGFDLGRPWRIWHPLVMWNPHSVMFEIGWCVMLYTTVLALEFSPLVLEHLGLKTPLKIMHRIFVPLVGNTKIWLTESTDGFYFEVTDANGTDGDAGFMLPNPDPECTGTTWYSVYYRLLGTPGGSSTIETCYKDGADIYCASDLDGGVVAVSKTRGSGKPVFDNVSRDLLYVDICTQWDEDVCTRVKQTPLFGLDAYEYLWDYNNDGARVAQLRFYEVPTDSGFTSDDLVCDET